MNLRTFSTVLSAAALALGSGVALAQDKGASDPAVQRHLEKKKQQQQAAQVKPVDINSASKDELKKTAGLSDEYAAKIVAGRPYVSKADLVTRKVIPEGVYVQIRKKIVALPVKGGAKNMAGKQH